MIHLKNQYVITVNKHEHYANEKRGMHRTDNIKILMNNREYEMFWKTVSTLIS